MMAGERKLIKEQVNQMLLKEYLQKEVQRSGFGGMKVQRGPMSTNISLEIQRPGLVIGKKGSVISNLTNRIANKFGIENPQIEIQATKDPSLNSQLMAYQLTKMLRRGWNCRRAAYTIVGRIMEAGAKGCEVTISGKLTSQRHRTLKIIESYIKHSGDAAKDVMEKGYAVAKLKPGIIGVVVNIMKSDASLPDKIEEVLKREEEKEAEAVQKEVKEEKEISLDQVPEITPSLVKKLATANIDNLAELKEATIEDLMAIKGVGRQTTDLIKKIVKEIEGKKKEKKR
jgi:small subunit ribosomal protein S3